jgi:hypothetical protein
VRTIFASNSVQTPDYGAFHENLNWIKTIHKVKQSVVVDLQEKMKISSDCTEKVVCATGYEENTKAVRRIENTSIQETSVKKAKKIFHTFGA